MQYRGAWVASRSARSGPQTRRTPPPTPCPRPLRPAPRLPSSKLQGLEEFGEREDHEWLLNPVLGHRLGDHSVLRHETVLNSVLGQNHEDLLATFATDFSAPVFCDAILNLPAFAATDTSSECPRPLQRTSPPLSSAMQPRTSPSFSADPENVVELCSGTELFKPLETAAPEIDVELRPATEPGRPPRTTIAMNWNVNGLLDRMLDDTG